MYRIPALATAFALSALIVAATATAAFPGGNGKIVFQTNRGGNAEIFTMNANGTNRFTLTRNSTEDTTPRSSHDGRHIVFASNRDGNDEIFTMNDVGGAVR